MSRRRIGFLAAFAAVAAVITLVRVVPSASAQEGEQTVDLGHIVDVAAAQFTSASAQEEGPTAQDGPNVGAADVVNVSIPVIK
jgi:hypothetical protein